jgi:hypothetical protein
MDNKKLFEGLMLYLKLRYKDENDIQIRYLMVGGQIDNTDTEGYTIPSNFLGFLEGIIYDNIEKIRDESYSEVSDYYYVYLNIETTNKQLVFTSESYEMSETPSEYSVPLSETEMEIVRNSGVNQLAIDYSGYGDSGSIESSYMDENGNYQEIPTEIEDILYRVLEDAYGGWEINDGSYGTINIEDGEVSIEHVWKEEELSETPLNLVITKDDI